MSWTLAITGKGGVGKTTLAALAVRRLVEAGKGPVLAVDADPNTSLDALLGVEARATVGGVREEAKQITEGGAGKQQMLDLKIQQSLVEADAFDLIAMGRPEGPGCYCYANNVLRDVLKRLAGQYPAVVIDNEAGLENLSRRTMQKVDWLLFTADPSARGLKTARRLFDLSQEMEISAGAMGLVVNRARDTECLRRAAEIFEGEAVRILGTLPEDDEVAQFDAAGRPLMALPEANKVYTAAKVILDDIVNRQHEGKTKEKTSRDRR
ncbi:MAG: ATP-binding protein [Planctomycetota bacterium]|jgi:CO dehydrogenase maturation factor